MPSKEGKIKITSGNVSEEGVLFVDASPCAKKIYDALPLKGTASLWGDEVYFTIPLGCPLEPEARAEVEVGSLGYWPTGEAFCIFFGPTPASSGHAPVAASPVNLVGKIPGDATVFRGVKSGETVSLARA